MNHEARPPLSGRVAACTSLAAAVAFALPVAAEDEDHWHISVGPGLVSTAEYPGSDDQELLPIPALDIRYGSLFLDWRRGLGGYLVRDERYEIGASVWLRRGRDGDADTAVAAFEDIDDSAVAQIFFNRSFGPLLLSTTVAQSVSGNTGLTVDASAAWRMQFSQATRASFGVQASFGNDRYMRTWFGVTPEQASVSGLQEYALDGGLKTVGGFASVSQQLSPRWTLAAFAAFDVLTGDASDSPVVERTGMPTVGLGAFYQFDP